MIRHLLVLSALTATTALASPVPASVDLPELVEKTLPGVVNVSSVTIQQAMPRGLEDFYRFWGLPQERRQSALGSGFILDKDGYILTNDHVVENADEVMVTLLDKRTFRAKIVGADPKLDVALLQIKEKGKAVGDLKPVPTGDSEKVRIAESVFAVGNPFGLQHTVTMGIISAKNRTIGQGPFDNFLQTDASINPGNSGGPLFNLRGEVVGINTMIFSRVGQSGGVGFAIPINEALKVIADLKRYGRVPRPWLGVFGEKMNEQLQAYYRLPIDHGVLVYKLVEDAPGHVGGLRPGDIITGLDGQEIDEPLTLERLIAKHRPTDSVKLKVKRARKELTLSLKLEELPKTQRLPQGVL